MATSRIWKPKKNCPPDIDKLRTELTALAKKKSGGKLISAKYTKDHIFAGHNGDIAKLAAHLAKLRALPMSTLMITSMTGNAQAEVINWIKKVPARSLTYSASAKSWTISNRGSAVDAVNTYKFATVDLDALKAMNKDDVVKKSRKWLKVSQKKPKIACLFESDGTPVIYHLDY